MWSLSEPWAHDRFTGLFKDSRSVPALPHDPDLFAWAGLLPGDPALAVGGIGWDQAGAEAAAVGEGIERWRCRPEPGDLFLETSAASWGCDEPLIPPEKWVLFHPEQYAQPGFPFAPFGKDSICRWCALRTWPRGEKVWAPDWLVYLQGCAHLYGPSLSTGLAAGRWGQPVLLRALQEVIERDALVGAWWGRYLLEEDDPRRIFALLPANQAERLRRPNLRYRGYRIATPYSAHVTMVTLEGEDRHGFLFSVGSACRSTRAASWEKAFLEAVQGRHYVRHLRAQGQTVDDVPSDFAMHSLYYTVHPQLLARTVLASARPGTTEDGTLEEMDALVERLGSDRPTCFRLLTPTWVSQAGKRWLVVRVVVPGLQPLHGNHHLPFLGGPLWSPRDLSDWRNVLPHPFP